MPATQAHVDAVHAAATAIKDLTEKFHVDLATAQTQLQVVLDEAAAAVNLAEGDIVSLTTEVPVITKVNGKTAFKLLPTLTTIGT